MSTISHAAIVFCDIVSFSKLSSDTQRTVITSLNAEMARELFPQMGIQGPMPNCICLPTGDGLLIVIRELEDARVLISLLISLSDWSIAMRECMADTATDTSLDHYCELRVGVHWGEVSIIPDINRLPNVCGDDINICRRIMDQARSNQVLFSIQAYNNYFGNGNSSRPSMLFESLEFSDPIRTTVKHDLQLSVRVLKEATEKGSSGAKGRWTDVSPKSAPLVIEGKTAVAERTEIINRHLTELLVSDTEILIYEFATFSTFSITSSADQLQNHEEHEIDLLLKQKRLLEQLVSKQNVRMRVLLRPIPDDVSSRFREVRNRWETLAGWMGETLINPTGSQPVPKVEFAQLRKSEANEQSQFPNRFVVKDAFRVDGYRLINSPGHGLSLVFFDDKPIDEAIAYVNQHFPVDDSKLKSGNEVIYETVTKLIKQWRKAKKTKRRKTN